MTSSLELFIKGRECACCSKPAKGWEPRFAYFYCEDHEHTPPVDVPALKEQKATQNQLLYKVIEERNDLLVKVRQQAEQIEGLETELAITDIAQRGKLADLAAQNQQLREALKLIRGHINLFHLFSCEGGDSYDPECADRNIDKVLSLAKDALALPDIATPVLNKAKAEALRSAASCWKTPASYSSDYVEEWLYDRADAIEKGEG